ncbi:ABC transporter permease [Dickeya fangzhongdai]|uniref:ABC transporter permease n=1 Tax=Dickeya fangzhongdai TaxID=1778540 RepID=UPI0023E41CC4|nr:ABC transporter permease subunit [Dickeya fangzhongdai]WES87625.1 ABC transporter permease subunit [Dickeya fangzhongdai]
MNKPLVMHKSWFVKAPQATRPLTPRQTRRIAAPLLLPLAVLLLWSLSSLQGWMPPQILPAPSRVAATAVALLQGDLLSQLLISLHRLVSGLAAGVLAGTLLGALMGASVRAERLLYPTVYALAQIPTLGWIPLFMVLFGIDDGLKLAVLIKAVIVPVTLHSQRGVRDVPPHLLDVARTLRLPRLTRLTRLILPAALPVWFTGLRLALSQAWVSLIVVELLASSQGIGYLMVWGRQLFQLDIVLVCIAVIGLTGLLMEWGINQLDKRLIAWPHPPVGRLHAVPAGQTIGLAAPLLLLALWQLASYHRWIDALLLPPPGDVLRAIWHGVREGSLPDAMRHSLWRALMGGALGASAGLLAGLALGLSARAEAVFTPTLTLLRQVALFAWLPLITAWVGNDDGGKVTFIALVAFFPMLVASHRGVRQRSLALQEVAQVLRLPWLRRLRVLILPGAAPALFTGLRLAMIYAWLGAIGAEYFMSSGVGIGSLMINAQQLLDMPIILSGMLLIGVTGALIDYLGQRLERRVTRWRTTGDTQ